MSTNIDHQIPKQKQHKVPSCFEINIIKNEIKWMTIDEIDNINKNKKDRWRDWYIYIYIYIHT